MRKSSVSGLAVLACCALLASGAQGCSLARDHAQGTLCGIYVTTKSVRELCPEKIADDGRVYAELIEKTETDDGCVVSKSKEFVFEGVEGMPMFMYTVPAADGFGPYNSFAGDGSITASLMVSSSGYVKGNLCILAGRDMIIYPNPVYQTSDGRVYLVTAAIGDGYSGPAGSSGTTSYIDNGEAGSFTAELAVSVITVPESVTVLAMDNSYRVVDTFTYDAKDAPSDYTPPKNASFLIVETAKRNPDGSLTVSRELAGRGDDRLSAFSARDDGICVMNYTAIKWPGGTGE